MVSRFTIADGDDAFGFYAAWVSNEETTDSNEYVYLGEVATARLSGKGNYDFQWDAYDVYFDDNFVIVPEGGFANIKVDLLPVFPGTCNIEVLATDNFDNESGILNYRVNALTDAFFTSGEPMLKVARGATGDIRVSWETSDRFILPFGDWGMDSRGSNPSQSGRGAERDIRSTGCWKHSVLPIDQGSMTGVPRILLLLVGRHSVEP